MHWIRINKDILENLKKTNTRLLVYDSDELADMDYVSQKRDPSVATDLLRYDEIDDMYFTYVYENAYSIENVIKNFSHCCWITDPN